MVLAPAVSFERFDMIASCREGLTTCLGLDRTRVMCLRSVRIQLSNLSAFGKMTGDDMGGVSSFVSHALSNISLLTGICLVEGGDENL